MNNNADKRPHTPYQPGDFEENVAKAWEKSNAFTANPKRDGNPNDAFCIMIPPPNVTGSLHIGHALNNTLQDILVRQHRMRGQNVLWQPGYDHAGIATQIVVERDLESRGTSRKTIGREAFLKEVWKWKEKSALRIERQLKRLGCSCDWSRTRFTLDEGLSRAVIKAFVALHRDGLIYRDLRLVNWDPSLQTAVSDLEVVQKQVNGALHHIRYPFADNPSQHLVVATTRPETMLGDVAVAVHPDDPRYASFIGKDLILPLVERRIPVIADAAVDPEYGVGALKITPAHDFTDFEIAQRHNLEPLRVLDDAARVSVDVLDLKGLSREDARTRVLELLNQRDLLLHEEPIVHSVPHAERTGVVVEPALTYQWFMDMDAEGNALADGARDAVKNGDTRFTPKQWEKTYFNWLEEIRPWCLSRQLWWGHRIPAWHAPNGDTFVAHDDAEAAALARDKYGKDVPLEQDPDVLDTWFSSALWPFSTLGWPDETTELKRYYPTDVLVTGFDIIFFWVARMMMIALRFMDDVPFKEVYVHALVRDAEGQKMSKSRGNVLDPLDLAEEFGADALRFTLAALASPGRDVSLSKPRIEGYRNFIAKVWSAARFLELNHVSLKDAHLPEGALQRPENRWLLHRADHAIRAASDALEERRFDHAADAAYHFAWREFCDWGVEFSKLTLADNPLADETRSVLAASFSILLRLLHPIAPFATESLWGRLGGKGLIAHAPWPETNPSLQEQNDASQSTQWLIDAVKRIRSVRSKLRVPAAVVCNASILTSASGPESAWAKAHEIAFPRFARINFNISPLNAPSYLAFVAVSADSRIGLDVREHVDKSAEIERLQRETNDVNARIKALKSRLNNPQFLQRAPDAVRSKTQQDLAASLEEQALSHELVHALKNAQF